MPDVTFTIAKYCRNIELKYSKVNLYMETRGQWPFRSAGKRAMMSIARLLGGHRGLIF